MNITEMREEAIRQFVKKVEAIDDSKSLEAVLALVDDIGKQETTKLDLTRHYDTIKSKYSQVLHKLAQ